MTIQIADPHALAIHLDRLMRRINADLRPKAMRADDFNVGPLGGMILITIEECAPIAVQDLANRLARDKAQMTRLLQSLERKGLIVRTESKADRRVSLISLTDEGEALVAAFRQAIAELTQSLLADVTPQEQKAFLAVLQKMLNAPGE